MKNLIILLCFVIVLPSAGQITESGWKIGLQLGSSGNSARFSGGTENANGRFNQNDFGAGSFGFVARYDLCRHLSIESGIGVNTFGFNYSIAENYSLIQGKKPSTIETSFAALELPLDLYYKFNLNCRNARWVLGIGLAPTFRGQESVDKNFSVTTEGSPTNYLKSNSEFFNETFLLMRYSVGREKVFRNNSVLRVSLLVNVGFTDLATSTVQYTLDNTEYLHTFKNNGSSVGLRFAYFLSTHRVSNTPKG